MAKDKKSFILYCDQQGVFNQLPDDIAGKLIKHIFAYVNDENPVINDLLINIAFEPIKLQLKRDLQKYEDIRKRNQDNARKRWDATASSGIPNDTKNADSVSVSGSVIVKEKKEIKGFVKPTIEQLKEYMSEQGMNDIAENWLNHYEANGWMVGKVKMKDWKASVRTWKINQKNNSATPQVVHKKMFNLSDYE